MISVRLGRFVYNVAMSIVANYTTWNSIRNLSDDISSRAIEANIQRCRTTARKYLTAGRNRTSQFLFDFQATLVKWL